MFCLSTVENKNIQEQLNYDFSPICIGFNLHGVLV